MEIKKVFIDATKGIKEKFIKDSEVSDKKEINWASTKLTGISIITLFIAIVLLMPSEQTIEFSEKIEADRKNREAVNNEDIQRENMASRVWNSYNGGDSYAGKGKSEINYNTSMVIGPKGGNAKTQIRAGHHLPLRILEKFVASDFSVPVLAELILPVETESGLKLAAGTKFYGEASYQKGQDRAQIRFTQISLVTGEIKSISGMALGKDGQPGITGRVYSDGAKNTAGQVLTTFVAGLAGGSVERDIFGGSKGGVQNGLLSAVAETAKDRAQAYGEKLKAEREWIEVSADSECDAVFDKSLSLQLGESNE